MHPLRRKMPSAEPLTIAAPKSSAQRQREYRQRIAASRTPAQSIAARKSGTERIRNYRLRKAANLALASGSLESTTASSSRSAGRSNDFQNCTQRQLTNQQRQCLAAEPAQTTVQPGTSDQVEVQQAQSTWNTKWKSSIMRFTSTFLDNDFGYNCSVCDRLWFRNDLKPITAAQLKDQTKIVIAKVYHYFEQEYEELKKSFDGLELTPLSKFRQRTALATGVSETTVEQILQEEARRNAEVREEPSRTEGLTRKRPRQTDSSSEEESENNEDGDNEQSGTVHEEEPLVVVKEEPVEESQESYNEEPEIYVELPLVKNEPGVSGANDAPADPISIDIKTEASNEEATSSNDTLGKKRVANNFKGKKTKRSTEAPTAASAPPAPNAPPAPPRRQLLLLDDGDIKLEQRESEEGFS